MEGWQAGLGWAGTFACHTKSGSRLSSLFIFFFFFFAAGGWFLLREMLAGAGCLEGRGPNPQCLSRPERGLLMLLPLLPIAVPINPNSCLRVILHLPCSSSTSSSSPRPPPPLLPSHFLPSHSFHNTLKLNICITSNSHCSLSPSLSPFAHFLLPPSQPSSCRNSLLSPSRLTYAFGPVSNQSRARLSTQLGPSLSDSSQPPSLQQNTQLDRG